MQKLDFHARAGTRGLDCSCRQFLTLKSHPVFPSAFRAQHSRFAPGRPHRGNLQVQRAAEEAVETKPLVQQPKESSAREGNFQPAISPEELPKGVRKEVRIGDQSVLLLWYKNEIYAIETRSPAEGAYSEGFIAAKLNQDYCIECPSTSTLFDLRTGEIKAWYPSNPVLRLITPRDTCRPLITFPVKLTQESILVDVSKAQTAASTRGGADLAAQKQDVASLEPKEFFQGSEQDTDPNSTQQGTPLGQAFTAIVAIVGVVGLAAAGTATAIYKDSFIGLVLFWAAFTLGGGVYVYSIFNNNREQP